MFDIEYFQRDPRPFFKFAKEIYPGQFQPSPCHKFISMMDKQGKLLRNYTQNIDTLEQVAGVQRIIQCHGSFATASCLICKYKVDCEAIREDIFNQLFLPSYPDSIPHEVPQVLINREQLPHLTFDVELLGDCDVIVNELCHRLGGDFEQLCYNTVRLTEITEKPPRLPEQPPCEALSAAATADGTPEEPKQHSADSVQKPSPQSPNVTESDGHVAPLEPCPDAQCPSEGNSEPSQLPVKDASKEESTEERSQSSHHEFRRRCWMNRISRSPISKRLDTGQYLFQAPHHYIFHGAEVYSDSEEETSSSCESDSEESECSGDEGADVSEPEEADGAACLRDTIQDSLANEATTSLQTNNTAEQTHCTTQHL
uniref:Sirtuin 1 n=1 Tax=Hippocampus comes TaxID=109280 RepID=A0A3Q2YLT7_HIPCM